MSNPSMSVAQRAENQLASSRLNVLIVGAGIAGATLGALLRQRGEVAFIIERASVNSAEGYMHGLMPLGGRVLNGLGVNPAYLQASQPMKYYVAHGRHGQTLRSYDMTRIVQQFGPYQGIDRGGLLKLLRRAAGDIQFDTTIQTIEQMPGGVAVTFNDGSSTMFDLVVGADGIHSHVRQSILRPDETEPFDTGWGRFVFWSDPTDKQMDTYREFWAAGWEIGLYPVRDRVGLFLAGQHKDIAQRDLNEYVSWLRSNRLPSLFKKALNHIQPHQHAVYWPMKDVRTKTWHRGGVVLLGDAATAFLPTAGVGASIAMDSAAALADELSRADPDYLEYALSLYERRQRPRAEKAQKHSRDLSRFMFLNTAWQTLLRDQAMRFYSLERLIKDISAVMQSA